MDNFSIIQLTLLSDCFMAQHQFNTEIKIFKATEKVGVEFIHFFSQIVGTEKVAHYCDDAKVLIEVELTADEIERVTDWITSFNHTTRKPLGLVMPDLYLGEEKVSAATANLYWSRAIDFLVYMLGKEGEMGREAVAQWAMETFNPFFLNVYGEALKAQ